MHALDCDRRQTAIGGGADIKKVVATLGDDVKRAAERKFKEINDAKEKIFKARGI